MQKFVVIGLPRSGSTYISTLLNSHPDVHSAGELFNPYEVIDIEHDSSDEAVLARDARPLQAAQAFFDRAEVNGMRAAGFKFMIGHNVSVLQWIARQPDIKIIYIRRENKLAQLSSYLKAMHTKEWAQTEPKGDLPKTVRKARSALRTLLPFGRRPAPERRAAAPHPDLDDEGRLTLGPRRVSLMWHEMATSDFLFGHWLQSVPNDVLRITYADMRRPQSHRRLCRFIGVPVSDALASPLIKQGSHTILDRFVHQSTIKAYFERRGLAKWLGEELTPEPEAGDTSEKRALDKTGS